MLILNISCSISRESKHGSRCSANSPLPPSARSPGDTALGFPGPGSKSVSSGDPRVYASWNPALNRLALLGWVSPRKGTARPKVSESRGRGAGDDTTSGHPDGTLLLAAALGHLQESPGEALRVRGAPERPKINLPRAGFHSVTERLAEARAHKRPHHIWSNTRQALFHRCKRSREGDSENTSSSGKGPTPTPGCPGPALAREGLGLGHPGGSAGGLLAAPPLLLVVGADRPAAEAPPLHPQKGGEIKSRRGSNWIPRT